MFEEQVTASITVFQTAVDATERNITQQWVNQRRIHENVFTCPFFESDAAFRTCLKDITEMWKPHIKGLIKQVDQRLKNTLNSVPQVTIDVSKTLWDKSQEKWMEYYPSLISVLRSKCEVLLAQERDFGTLNRSLVEAYTAHEQVATDEFFEHLFSRCLGK